MFIPLSPSNFITAKSLSTFSLIVSSAYSFSAISETWTSEGFKLPCCAIFVLALSFNSFCTATGSNLNFLVKASSQASLADLIASNSYSKFFISVVTSIFAPGLFASSLKDIASFLSLDNSDTALT